MCQVYIWIGEFGKNTLTRHDFVEALNCSFCQNHSSSTWFYLSLSTKKCV